VLNVQPSQPATCYFICYIGILCSLRINDDDDLSVVGRMRTSFGWESIRLLQIHHGTI